jgi:hypothetical protein
VENVQNVSRLNDQAPSSPDHTRASEGKVLGEGELLCWTVEIGDTCEDDTPLHPDICQRPSLIWEFALMSGESMALRSHQWAGCSTSQI